jgi:RNA-binding protein
MQTRNPRLTPSASKTRAPTVAALPSIPKALLKPLPLSPADRRELKGLAHHLDPVIMIGDKGLSDSVMLETAAALKAHGLIKIRVMGDERDARLEMLSKLCDQLGCEKVQTIGKLLVVYRPKTEQLPKEHIPKKLQGAHEERGAKRKSSR